MSKCLYCYQEISAKENVGLEYHQKCSQIFFGSKKPPVIEYTQEEMHGLATKIIQSQKVVTGAQAKLSLSRMKKSKDNPIDRFSLVGLWGEYILKPQTKSYKELPEIEDLTMNLAALSKVPTVSHSLIRLQSGELAYITKRIDRAKGKKVHVEDMCQLTERMTEHKYKGSYEQIGKAINKYAANAGFNLINFYELVIFSYLTGNNDMHLKNFSLIKNEKKEYNLCPAYDLVAAELVVENDNEELALNLNGKKRRLKRKDFITAMKTNKINEKAIENIFSKFEHLMANWTKLINISFLSPKMKEAYIEMLEIKFKTLYH